MALRSRPDWGRQKGRQKKKTCCYPDLHAKAVPHSLPVMMFVTSYSTGKQAERQRPLDRGSIVSVEVVHRWRRSQCLLESSTTLSVRSMSAMAYFNNKPTDNRVCRRRGAASSEGFAFFGVQPTLRTNKWFRSQEDQNFCQYQLESKPQVS